MAFNQELAEAELSRTLQRIERVEYSIRTDILRYRRADTLTSEGDQYRTMKDIRFYLRRAYGEIDEILTDLDRYRD